MARKKPKVGQIPVQNLKIPPTPTREKPLKWTFSFRFWKQIEYFGLDKSTPSWFVSLLDRLHELSTTRVDDFLSDRSAKQYHRYHEIDWTQKNIPIDRKELTWIDQDYRENADDYPLYQFMISKALGRIVGFWDEKSVFCIVLLDPLHNIQPSKSFSYRLDPCSPLPCEYTGLLLGLEAARSLRCPEPGCPVREALDTLPDVEKRRQVIVTSLEPETADMVHSLLTSQRAASIEEIIETALLEAYTIDAKESGSSEDDTFTVTS